MKTRYLLFVFLICAYITISAINHHVPTDFSTIQAAITASASGDTVFVAPGTYTENINWPQTDGITLKSTGDRINTIIDANHSSRGIGFVGSSVNPVITNETRIDGFTIRNGYSNLNGAGVICFYASPEFSNCIIAYNESTESGAGGGIYCYGASPVFNNVIIAYNKALSGGGINISSDSSPQFNYCVIADNSLFPSGGSYASGIYGRGDVDFQLNNCIITRNRSMTSAAIHIGETCIPSIQHCTITDNDFGIEIVLNGGLSMQNCNIINNYFAGLWHNDTDTDIIDAQHNWWGSNNGPFQSEANPAGQGDIVTGNVDCTNWLLSYDTLAPLTPPTGINISNITNTSFTITWSINPEPNITGYVINYGVYALPVSVICPDNLNTPNTSYTIQNLAPNTVYEIQIAAKNSNNVQSWYSQKITVLTSNGNANEDMVMPAPVLINSYPNPFSSSTNIRFELKQAGEVSLNIYNVKGELIKHILNGKQAAGASEVNWNGRNNKNEIVGTGIYFIRLVQNGKISNSKLLLIK